MGKYQNPKDEMPEPIQSELGKILIYIIKEVLTIDNKYGYKVPLITSEHKATKKQEEFFSVSILRIN